VRLLSELNSVARCLRTQNNHNRKRVYQDVACKLKYTYRAPLPECIVAYVRSIWPSETGVYMGYKPHAEGDGSESDDGSACGDGLMDISSDNSDMSGDSGSEDDTHQLPGVAMRQLPGVVMHGPGGGAAFGGFGGGFGAPDV